MKNRRFRSLIIIWLVLAAGLAAQDEMSCADCHDVSIADSIHADMLSCLDCHVDLKIDTHVDDGAPPASCAACHEQAEPEQMARDIHLRIGDRADGMAPKCADCHGSHEVKAVASLGDPSQQFCQSCHSDEVELNTLYHQIPFVPNEDCTMCHDQQDYSAIVDHSVHNDFACANCHDYAAAHPMDHSETTPFQRKASCSLCHADVAKVHRNSIHGISLAEGIDEAANCWNCHGDHAIEPVASTTSPVHGDNLPDTCGKCHNDPDFVGQFQMGFRDVIGQYHNSIHGRLAAEGREDVPNCATCHNTHDIKNRVQPGSSISSFNVPDTCGQCHADIAQEYKESVHWIQAKRGIRESPVCNDCHSEHAIQPVDSDISRAQARQLQNDSCIRCHQDPVKARRFDFSANRPNEYLDSYHGLAVLRGDEDAALCIDCHGIHKILPNEHPDSMIHHDNVRETCANCHTGASQTFALSYAHNEVVVSSMTVEYWVRQIYIWMIILIISGMFVHNVMILIFELRKHRKQSKEQVKLRRFTGNEVIQHLLLMLLFTLLALTGFALKFPDFALFRLFAWMGLDEPTRQLFHRGSGLLLSVLGVYHVIYLLVTASGRQLLKHMMPRFSDVREMIGNILYHLHLRQRQPEFHRFNYIEKSEYWALMWGTVIMALTGFILWFPTIVGDWAPIWLIRVSEMIHYYEAILATLAIIVWHLFFVMYHPKEYPMNMTWVDGEISLDAFKHHYRQQYKDLVAEWWQHKQEKTPEASLSYEARRFMRTVRKHGQDPDAVLQRELEEEPGLREWVTERVQTPNGDTDQGEDPEQKQD